MSGDEVGRLKARLEAGEWRALLEPGAEGLLDLTLLMNPTYRDEVVCHVGPALAGELAKEHKRLEASRKFRKMRRGWHGCALLSARIQMAAAMTITAYAVRTCGGPDHRRALAILERLAPR